MTEAWSDRVSACSQSVFWSVSIGLMIKMHEVTVVHICGVDCSCRELPLPDFTIKTEQTVCVKFITLLII